MIGQGKDFGPYFAATNIITQLLNMTVPLLSAQVIRFFDYTGSFVLMLAFIALMLVFTAKLPEISLKDHMPPGQSWLSQMRIGVIQMVFRIVFGGGVHFTISRAVRPVIYVQHYSVYHGWRCC